LLCESPVEKAGIKQNRSETFVQAYSIRNLDEKKIVLSPKDKTDIEQFCKANKGKILVHLADQFAQHIAGSHHIKQAILLQLVSSDADFSNFSKRGRIHGYIVGSYGSGKTQIAKSGHKVSLKSLYVNVSQSSKVGLTASVVRDNYLNAWTLEAGAVALAGDGLCILDEIDKSPKDESLGLGEPMEEGTITVSKANIHQTIPAPAKVLACGNFVKDSLENQTIIPENVNVDGHVLDRFDFIFRSEGVDTDTLADKVFQSQNDVDCLEYMQKHIFLAQSQVVNALLDQEIRLLFVQFAKEVKKTAPYSDGNRFSARLLQSLWRFAVASAKIRFSDKVELEDAEISIELVRRSLRDRDCLSEDLVVSNTDLGDED